MPCVARGALGPSERSARRLRPEAPHRDPRDHQLVGGPRRGREGRGVELGERTLGLVDAPDQEEAPDLEIPRMRGVRPGRRALRASPAPRRAPSQASPGRARRARSRPRRRRTSRGPRPLSDRRRAPHCRRSAFARTRSPSCAIAMPRSASAGASSRRATRFNAPRGSPAASARAAAVISESIGIPPHLSLPPFDTPRSVYLMTNGHRSDRDGNMQVVGATLVATLLNEDLIDELRLIVHPIVLGNEARRGGWSCSRRRRSSRAA